MQPSSSASTATDASAIPTAPAALTWRARWRQLNTAGRVGGEAASTLVRAYLGLVVVACGLLTVSVVLFPGLYARPWGVVILSFIFAGCAAWARVLCERGQPDHVCRIYAVVSWVIGALYLTLSQQVALGGLMVVSFLPVLTAVAGLSTALTYAGSFLLLAIGLFVASRLGMAPRCISPARRWAR